MRWTRANYAGSAVDTARRLVGAHLVHETPGGRTVLRITETEAYGGWYEGRPDDGAHAYRGRTARTEVLFGEPGHAYVYLIYGMYCCFNISCDGEGTAGCVLLRAGEPVEGEELIRQRRGKAKGTALTCGPGRLCLAMAIDRSLYGADLVTGPLYVESGSPCEIEISRRKHIDYATYGREFPWRFTLKGSLWVSR